MEALAQKRALAAGQVPESYHRRRLTGPGGGIRTRNLPLDRRLLCQLSYPGACSNPMDAAGGEA